MCCRKKKGGRHTPFFKGYRPQFYFRTTDVTGEGVSYQKGVEMVMPGDNIGMMVCDVDQPDCDGGGPALCDTRGWSYGRCKASWQRLS